MVMRVVETVRRDKVKRVISSAMYRNAERDRGKKDDTLFFVDKPVTGFISYISK